MKVSVPPSAAWLGGSGLLPFAGLAASLVVLGPEQQLRATHALLAYGATILSFLGGIHWGMGISRQSNGDGSGLAAQLALSVIPSLLAWVALLLTPVGGLLVLAAGIMMMLGVDILATRNGLAPAWYPRLRIPLSGAVALTLLAAVLVLR